MTKEEYKAKKLEELESHMNNWLFDMSQCDEDEVWNMKKEDILAFLSQTIDELANANNTGGYPNIKVPCVFEDSPKERAAYRLGYYDHQDNFWDNLGNACIAEADRMRDLSIKK